MPFSLPLAADVATSPTPGWAWYVFAGVVLTALLVDLLIVNRKAHVPSMKEAGAWCVVWVGLAVGFNFFVAHLKGGEVGMQFTTAYLVELALSVDNLFIFLVIFGFFAVPPQYQHRTLFWGIMGAVVLRGIMIFAGTELLHQFAWLIFVFGAVLIFTGIKLLLSREESYKPTETWAYRVTKRYVPLTDTLHGERFFIREGGRLLATPLFLVLVIVEATDVVFAVDSIPACLAISRDTFVVYSSNIFAILGLRSFFFLISGAMGALRFLKPALSVILVFIGLKMVVAEGFPDYKLDTKYSLSIVAGILAIAVGASILFPARHEDRQPS